MSRSALVLLGQTASPGRPVDGLYAHQAHQPPHPLPVDQIPLALKARSYLSCSIIRYHQVLAVNQLHEIEFLLSYSLWLVIQAGAADT